MGPLGVACDAADQRRRRDAARPANPSNAAVPGAGLATLTAGVGRSATVLRERLRPLTAELTREFGENAAIGVDVDNGYLLDVCCGMSLQLFQDTLSKAAKPGHDNRVSGGGSAKMIDEV